MARKTGRNTELTNQPPCKPVLTYGIASAAGHDAGMRSMRAGNRVVWNIDDYNAACAETNRLIDIIEELDNPQTVTCDASRDNL